ncbi:FdhD protein [Marinobacterium halophilum]|uniref:Sulfur carrier protein FdhD n=1 Tax=Marinobacterium halophilum TaxID=267374 RepID=A0A2P8ERF1_9GAMM|nr:formate dehydrogenase accessory sulfurtransferase FdhD [Marinobacterium halophilum]PSL12057.1 FdhD protein [Marinobacterium halophilum]
MAVLKGEQHVQVLRRKGAALECAEDQVADEVAVALAYNGLSHVVMMATPDNLEDFGRGFSLSEGIIERPEQLYGTEVVQHPLGIELQLELATECFEKLKHRRRNLAGRTGCGLCGAESLEQAIGTPRLVRPAPLPSADAIENALTQLRKHQQLQRSTGAVHGAALCDESGRVRLLREDVGRHNALDKLIGAMASCCIQDSTDYAGRFVLITSRASFEMVHKCAAANIGALVAVSAPTALAIEQASRAGIHLIGFARQGRHVIYTTTDNGDDSHVA